MGRQIKDGYPNVVLMLSSKRKGFFYKASEFSYYGATATAFEPPLTVQEFVLLPRAEEPKFRSIIDGMASGNGKRRIIQGNCTIYPESRFICRSSIDTKKLKDPNYLSEHSHQMFLRPPN